MGEKSRPVISDKEPSTSRICKFLKNKQQQQQTSELSERPLPICDRALDPNMRLEDWGSFSLKEEPGIQWISKHTQPSEKETQIPH